MVFRVHDLPSLATKVQSHAQTLLDVTVEPIEADLAQGGLSLVLELVLAIVLVLVLAILSLH